MPSKETKSKQYIRRRPQVGRKIKFYETKDETEEANLNPSLEIKTENRRSLGKSATLPHRKKPPEVRPSVIDVTSKLTARSARSRDKIRKADDTTSLQSRDHLETNIQLDENENVAKKSQRNTSVERKYREKTRGLQGNLSSETQQQHTSTSDASKGVHAAQSLKAEDQAIAFLPTSDIGRIYQSQPEQQWVNRQFESLSPDPDEYHWKIVESRKNLQELQKSLANDISDETLQPTTSDYPLNLEDAASEMLRSPAHQRVSKQESNTSVSSNLSTSSTLSIKLLSLSEGSKTERIPRRRSQKSKSKDPSWTEGLSSRERSGSQTYEVTGKSTRRRRASSGIQYSEDDIRSPTNPSTETSKNNAAEKNAKNYASGDNATTSDVAGQSELGTSTSASSPLDPDYQEQPSNEFFQEHSSNSSELHKDGQDDDFEHGSTLASNLNIKQNLSVKEPKETQKAEEKEMHHYRSHSGKFNSMPRMASKYVFKVDFDEQQNSQYSRKSRKESRRSTRKDNESELWANSQRNENDLSTKESNGEQGKDEDKGDEAKKTPSSIPSQPPPTHSKRLQVRPWNMLGHLSNNVTQTPCITTRDTLSQTKTKYFEVISTQTEEKTYKSVGVQTDTPITKQESAAQISPSVETVEVQTMDDLSEGATISLDNLIRMGAIKRTRSLGLGLSQNLERPIVRSSSSNYTTNLRKEATEINSNKSVTVSTDGTETSGKIASYNWSENKKFVKIFVSYSGIHLIPSKNIQVKTNGINLLLTVEECVSWTKDGDELRTLTSTLYLNRLRRPVSCLSYNVQRDMVTIMLRKQKQTPWNALLFNGANA